MSSKAAKCRLPGTLTSNRRRYTGIDPAYVDAELTREEYPRFTYGELYPKLQALKAKFDDRDLFRYPQSIKADVG